MENLIVVKQLPQIEEHLKELSIKVEQKVENARSLVCTEENVKIIKQIRADLNKEFKEVEQQRKVVKEQILAPYMQFEEIYKTYISDKYRSADMDLKQKVDAVESELKARKEQEIKEYFEEYKTVNNIDFVSYGQARINVTLSASMKSLKEQAKQFIDKVVDDLNLIETQEHKTEILVEYKQTLNVSNAITTVINRIKAIEEEKRRPNDEITKQSHDEQEKAFKNEMKETQINEKTYTITFTVTDNVIRLKQLKDYLIREGYQYE